MTNGGDAESHQPSGREENSSIPEPLRSYLLEEEARKAAEKLGLTLGKDKTLSTVIQKGEIILTVEEIAKNEKVDLERSDAEVERHLNLSRELNRQLDDEFAELDEQVSEAMTTLFKQRGWKKPSM